MPSLRANRKSQTANRKLPKAFTLIEVMIVMGIAALVMAIGVPFVYNMLHKDPLRQAVSDVVEACTHTRAQAIFTGAPVDLRIRPKERALQVAASSSGIPQPEADAAGVGD